MQAQQDPEAQSCCTLVRIDDCGYPQEETPYPIKCRGWIPSPLHHTSPFPHSFFEYTVRLAQSKPTASWHQEWRKSLQHSFSVVYSQSFRSFSCSQMRGQRRLDSFQQVSSLWV